MLNVTTKIVLGQKLGDFNYFKNVIMGGISNGVSKICEEVKEAAIDSYAKQKKARPIMPSKIIDSFHFTTNGANTSTVHGIVFAGGPDASWAVFVNYPRKGFDGYLFMEEGAKHGQKIARDIMATEIAKVV